MAEEVVIRVTAEDNFTGVLGNFGNIITGIRSAVSLAADAFRALVAPVVEFGQESILAAARVSELQAVNQILAENAGIGEQAVIDAAQAVRSMGIEAAVSEKVVAEFVRANLDLAAASDIARIAQDAAVISGINSSEATDRIIEGIIKLNPLILRNAGIIVDLQQGYEDYAESIGTTAAELSTAEKQQVALNLVLEAGTAIAGAYAAAMEEPGKVLRSFPRYFDDIKVAIGEPFQEAFGTTIFAFADLAKWIAKGVEDGGIFTGILNDIAVWAEDKASSINTFLEGAMEYIDELIRRSSDFQLTSGGSWFNEAAAQGASYATIIDWNLLIANLDEDVGRFLQGFADAITEWVDSGGGTKLSMGIVAWINNLAAGDMEFNSATLNAAMNILTALGEALLAVDWSFISSSIIAGFNAIDWTQAGLSLSQSANSLAETFGEQLAEVDWGGIIISAITAGGEFTAGFFAGLFDLDVSSSLDQALDQWGFFFTELGNRIRIWWQGVLDEIRNFSLADALLAGINVSIVSLLMPFYNFINGVKALFGVASPSTVFYQIGVDILSGLLGGIGSMVGQVLAFIDMIVGIFIRPFEPLLDIIGSLLGGGTTSGSLGTVGTISGGTTATQTVNNYYYGPVYFGAAGEPGAYYDCPSPNPLMTAGAGLLP